METFQTYADQMLKAFPKPEAGKPTQKSNYAEAKRENDTIQSIEFKDSKDHKLLTTQTPATVTGAAYSEQINPKANAKDAYMAMFEHAQVASEHYGPGGTLQIHEIEPPENAKAFMAACKEFQKQGLQFNIVLDQGARDALTDEQQKEFDKMPKVEANQAPAHHGAGLFPAAQKAANSAGTLREIANATGKDELSAKEDKPTHSSTKRHGHD